MVKMSFLISSISDLLEVHGLQHSGECNAAHHGVVDLRTSKRQRCVMFMNPVSLEPPEMSREIEVTSNSEGH